MVDMVRRNLKEEWAQCSETLLCVVEDVARDMLGPPTLVSEHGVLWAHVTVYVAPVRRTLKKPQLQETSICI